MMPSEAVPWWRDSSLGAAGSARISAISAWQLAPLATEPMRFSEVAPSVVPRQTVVSVEISDEGTTETGIAAITRYLPEGWKEADPPLENLLSSWLGFPVAALPNEPTTEDIYEPSGHFLQAAVTLAGLDALGRRTGLPAATFLGGIHRSSLPAYASLPSFPDVDGAVDCAENAADQGFRSVKLHASGVVDVDVETIAAARRRLGPSMRLIWDASRAYDVSDAQRVGHTLDEHGYLWFEAPLEEDSSPALERLARRVSVALVPDGMAQRSVGDWARDLTNGIWGGLRLDLTRVGSISFALRLVRLAESMGVQCEIQSFGFPLSQYANLQLMIATRSCRFFECPFPSAGLEDGIVKAPEVIDGNVRLPAAPGLGHGVSVAEIGRDRPLLTPLSS